MLINRMRVLVATPFSAEHARLLGGWHGALRAGGEASFAVAVHDQEKHLFEPVDGVRFFTVSGRSGQLGARMLARIRLARLALEEGFDVLWFVSAGVRPPPGAWAAVRAALADGATQCVVVPHPVRWCAQPAFVKSFEGPGGAVLAAVPATTHKNCDQIAYGGFGCTAIRSAALGVPIKHGRAPVTLVWPGLGAASGSAVENEAVGWYAGLASAGLRAVGLNTPPACRVT